MTHIATCYESLLHGAFLMTLKGQFHTFPMVPLVFLSVRLLRTLILGPKDVLMNLTQSTECLWVLWTAERRLWIDGSC